jgi:CxxC motif-containing protein
VVLDRAGKTVSVRGHECPRGAAYAEAEAAHPVRVLATTVKIAGAAIGVVPVKTAGPVPKGRLEEIMRRLKGISVEAPVAAGAVVAADICGLGVNVVATRSLSRLGGGKT